MPKKPIKRVRRVPKDIRYSAVDMSKLEAQYLYKDYMSWRKLNQTSTHYRNILGKKGDHSDCINFITADIQRLRKNIVDMLDIWAENYITGRWVKSIPGLGPVVAGGLLSVVDIKRAPTSSSLCQFAGFGDKKRCTIPAGQKLVKASIDEYGHTPTPEHIKYIADALELNYERFNALCKIRQKSYSWDRIFWVMRIPPYNPIAHDATLIAIKGLVWNEGCYYNGIYKHNIERITLLNANGQYKKTAEFELTTKSYVRDTPAKRAYEAGKLPDSRIKAMARRAAVKAFLRHYWMVEYRAQTGEMPPEHYAIDVLGGSHKLVVPNWPSFE